MSARASDSAGPSPPTPESVRDQLERILASSPFATAARSRRFLTYIVEQTLAGKADGVKELVLGIEVFDRSSDFDPKLDTIVRVEAGKLRKRLREYYDKEGAHAPLRIEVPKGSYVPQFLSNEVPQARAVPHRQIGFYSLSVMLVILGGVWWGARVIRGPQAAAPSVAVLPFQNFTADPNNEYLADGLAEELTDALCRAGGMRVASRTSAFFFKGKQADVRDIGARLHVGYVIEGSVRRQDDRLKVTAQIIRTDDGYHVWSGSFVKDLRDVFAVEQETAASIVGVLQVELTGEQHRRLSKTHTASQLAFDLYLRGRHASRAGLTYNPETAERFFQQSIAADPAYPLPYVALADLYMYQNILQPRPARELATKAKENLTKALALDDELADAHAILGSLTARHEYDWASAERHLRYALQLNPNSALAHNELAQNVLAPLGRWQEAVAENHRAIELDPLSAEILAGEPWLAYLEGRNDAAIQGFRGMLADNPGSPAALIGVGAALLGKGDFQAGKETYRQLQRVWPSPLTLGIIGYAEARSGDAGAARRILEQLETESRTGFVSPVCFAAVYTGLGDAGAALRYLEEARRQQESFLIFAGVDSFFDPIRSDSRFSTLLVELNLSQLPAVHR